MELDLNVAEVAPEKTAAMATSDSGSSESWVLNAEVFGGWAALAEGSSSTPPSSAVLEFSILGSESDAVGAAAATPRHRHHTTTTSRNSSCENSFRLPHPPPQHWVDLGFFPAEPSRSQPDIRILPHPHAEQRKRGKR